MVRKEYPFKLSNKLGHYLRIKQAQLTIERDKPVTLQEVHKEMADYIGVARSAMAFIKSENYNPSLIVAMAIAEYLGVAVEDIFQIERKKEDTE
ncbi:MULTISPECIES: helix-turn-helix transcriptional regulator [Bacteria]|uniref:Transcriptional regulator n=1 Tax=Bacillus spizizenii TaxID=96241 RepID=A0A9Q4DLG9_BACSC|nr:MULTISPECIES: transcriptional regulator [Bacillus subtilis group]MCY8119573.1 transcriptional regulator [Bacillus spizizenii]MCY8155187.1 transcriptional regulator [Bacillus spizizenii]MCY8196544.1 transcriptional regulator [Bacillus spizizenii]MCY8219314.1 transcriptional regulator [Bacillus spizizenii]MCY8313007.1 transcriptional regulator [Bacillus spizizenii]